MHACAPFTKGQISLVKHIRDMLEFAIVSAPDFKNSLTDTTYHIETLIKGFALDDRIIQYHLSERGWELQDEICIYCVAN